ncbi:MAG: hypothetical protein MZV49_08285 [Rhodopseudomonas palustris]|nr:hypothetical protein [Rhodopseudomonas palustris]
MGPQSADAEARCRRRRLKIARRDGQRPGRRGLQLHQGAGAASGASWSSTRCTR